MTAQPPTVCLTFDFDAISIWIGPHQSNSPSLISRGEFGALAVGRILSLLARHNILATFFVPGHTAETYPAVTRQIAEAGHEIGYHGYLHERPGDLSPEEEHAVLVRGLQALESVTGVRPVGYRSPSWDNTAHTVGLLLEHGFRYESSLMANDFTPYWCRTGDVIQADGPYLFGQKVDLVEMPVSWILDDFPHFEYLKSGASVFPGLSAPSKVEEVWMGEFEYMSLHVPGGVYTLTMHPQVIGRGHRMLMFERLIGQFSAAGARFSTLAAAADAFRAAEQ